MLMARLTLYSEYVGTCVVYRIDLDVGIELLQHVVETVCVLVFTFVLNFNLSLFCFNGCFTC